MTSRWQAGRQPGGYEKRALFIGPLGLPIDAYLIRYPQGSEIAPHVDPVAAGKRHYRLNVVLRAADEGGEFVCAATLFASARVKLFRPDIAEHAVARIVRGSRLVLSVGWLVAEAER